MVYLISYDLKTVNKDYSGLYGAIMSCGEWLHPLESVWMVDTSKKNLNADQIIDIIRTHTSQEDTIFVCKIDKMERNGWMPKDSWLWLRSHEQ